MNKKTFINEILDIFDENEALKRRLKEYEKPKNTEPSVIEETPKDKMFNDLDKKAKELLFNDVFYVGWISSYNPVEVKEDSGDINFLTFPQWFKGLRVQDCMNSGQRKLLNVLSYNDLKTYFEKQFEDYFNQQVNDKRMEIVRSKKDQ